MFVVNWVVLGFVFEQFFVFFYVGEGVLGGIVGVGVEMFFFLFFKVVFGCVKQLGFFVLYFLFFVLEEGFCCCVDYDNFMFKVGDDYCDVKFVEYGV